MKKETIIIIFIISAFIFGIFTGIIIQQIIMIKGIERIGESWEGVISNMNIEIDINETQLVEATWKMFPKGEQKQ